MRTPLPISPEEETVETEGTEEALHATAETEMEREEGEAEGDWEWEYYETEGIADTKENLLLYYNPQK